MIITTLKKTSLLCAAFLTMSISCSGAQYEIQERDREIYKDLLAKPYESRIASVALDSRYGHGGPISLTPEFENNLRWFAEQKDKAYPVFLEIFRREPLERLGLQRKTMAIGYFRRNGGDKGEMLGEVRKLLEEIRTDPRRLRSIEVLTGQAFQLLAQDGTEDDLKLLESFTDDESLFIRNTAKRQAKILRERLPEEADTAPASPGNNNEEDAPPAVRNDEQKTGKPGLLTTIVVATALILTAGFFHLRRKRAITAR